MRSTRPKTATRFLSGELGRYANYKGQAMSLRFIVVITILFYSSTAASNNCNIAPSSSIFNENKRLVRVLNQFDLKLGDNQEKIEIKLKKMENVKGIKSEYLYLDPSVVEKKPLRYDCKNNGLAMIVSNPEKENPDLYQFCFITHHRTLNGIELYIQDYFNIPREKWLSKSTLSSNRDSLWGKFVWKTKYGSYIRNFVGGIYYLKYKNRFYSILIDNRIRKLNTSTSFHFFDLTSGVKKQSECEEI